MECGVLSLLLSKKGGLMGQTIINADMTLEEKLRAIARAIRAADGAETEGN